MDFSSNARKTQKPTIEHLEPISLGGSNKLDNLVLCHEGCNKQLADRPRIQKERMRARRMRKLGKAVPIVSNSVAPTTGVSPTPSCLNAKNEDHDWRLLAIIAAIAAAFFAGLSLGLYA